MSTLKLYVNADNQIEVVAETETTATVCLRAGTIAEVGATWDMPKRDLADFWNEHAPGGVRDPTVDDIVAVLSATQKAKLLALLQA